MNKFLPVLLLSVISLPAAAALPPTGYYRVQNQTTKRYTYVRDNKGRIDVGATTADYDAIWLIKDDERPHYDPSGIIRLIQKGGSRYDIEAQGTSVYDLIEMLPSIYDVNGQHYRIGGTSNGMTKYLCDGEANLEKELSFPRDAGGTAAQNRQRWDIFPVDDMYFGIKPEVTSEGKGYATFFADFPYTTQSEGMKMYTVVKTGNGMAALREATGVIPEGTPMLMECTGATPSDNRLTIGGTASADVDGNLLTGVYFNNTHSTRHWNVVEYDAATMRVLGLDASGKPAFITAGSDLKYIPANTAYIKVSADADAELRLVSEEEFDSSSAIDGIAADDNAVSIDINGLDITVTASATSASAAVEIISLAGNTVAKTVLQPSESATFTLPSHGLYILRTPGAARKFHL
ncbi:hypothetical protein [Muribaculum intestinale]|uniref:hypothetical protein n=1 Tax=Muribaculum intestinale TaxID=1796646 RepID=UPI00241C4E13|nr:hypothetical protein [Muribaculum intestinale]